MVDREVSTSAPQHHESEEAKRAIAELLAVFDGQVVPDGYLPPPLTDRLDRHVANLTAGERIALLKAAVGAMPDHRDLPADRAAGTILYATAVRLYGMRLPLDKSDLVDLLLLARHRCGHGEDTRPPFDLARAFQRRHGYSIELARAIDAFVACLPESRTTKVREIRRSAALMRVLDSDLSTIDPPDRGWWIDDVRAGLARVGGEERRAWERLVLSMSVGIRTTMPKSWEKVARSVVDEVGEPTVGGRLGEWWPDPARGTSLALDGSGGQLLKHFIWLLDLLPNDVGESLVVRLALFRWSSSRPPLQVLVPARAYLEDKTSDDARRAFELIASAIPELG